MFRLSLAPLHSIPFNAVTTTTHHRPTINNFAIAIIALPFSARMAVPKLVCEVSDASGFAWFVRVDGGLGSEKHDEQAELRVERYFSQSSQVVLG